MWFWSLKGCVSYEWVRELQLVLVELRYRKKIPDTLLFLEHEPVITRGRGLQYTGTPRLRQMPISTLIPPGISFAESERGGDLTYHGPGQLVMYPIFQLDGEGFAPDRDIGGFLRKWEAVIGAFLKDLGIESSSREHASGVWLGDKKIASVGIAIRKWVSYHGIALNCVNDLKPFHLISPCGFSPDVMTRLSEWAELPTDWRQFVEHGIARQIGQLSLQSLDQAEVLAILKGHLDHPEDPEALSESWRRLETHPALSL